MAWRDLQSDLEELFGEHRYDFLGDAEKRLHGAKKSEGTIKYRNSSEEDWIAFRSKYDKNKKPTSRQARDNWNLKRRAAYVRKEPKPKKPKDMSYKTRPAYRATQAAAARKRYHLKKELNAKGSIQPKDQGTALQVSNVTGNGEEGIRVCA